MAQIKAYHWTKCQGFTSLGKLYLLIAAASNALYRLCIRE